MKPTLHRLLVVALAFSGFRSIAADTVSVAAAANLAYVLAPLNAAFARTEPGTTVTTQIGASGGLVAQISNGAPYDVFLSADLDFPKELIAAGSADPASLVTFAYGKLVLWTTQPSLELDSIEKAVRDGRVHKIAVANPKTAPYGRAAEEVLAHLKLVDDATPKMIFGENITQTAQFVSSGNAELGFVALSLVMAPNLKDKGRWILVPDTYYEPLAQGGILTKRGGSNPAARRYLNFLQRPEARAVFASFGYRLP
jgi:molybdate transport system substrate-binding protein